jgi:hypothetical protein
VMPPYGVHFQCLQDSSFAGYNPFAADSASLLRCPTRVSAEVKS